MLKIKVPATSANLGPGYDSFGLALNLFNEYEFEIKKEVEKLSINIIDNKEKQQLKKIIDDNNFETMHSQEATLEEIFIKVTGRRLE